jgi:curli biogenesis system outer membrane secretion channel CsgG
MDSHRNSSRSLPGSFALLSGLLALTAAQAETAGADGQLKRRIAVMDMALTASSLSQSSPGSYSSTTNMPIPPPADFALGLTEMLTTELARTGRFIILERKSLSDVTAEQDLRPGKTNPDGGEKTRAVLAAQALIRCAVTEYAYSQTGSSGGIKIVPGLSLGASRVKALVGIDTRILDPHTGQVVGSVVTHGDASAKAADVKFTNSAVDVGAGGFVSTPLGQASREAIDAAVAFIVKELGQAPWQGRVVRAQGRQVYLNAGAEDGITTGLTFDVFRSDEPLVDPDSGVELGAPDRQIGTVRVASVKPRYSVAELLSGEAAQPNDIVRPAGAGANP